MFRRQQSGGVQKIKKRKTKVLPDWDATINDLSVHRASPAEVQHRRLLHKSKNADKAKRELEERQKRLMQKSVNISPVEVELEMKKLAILKEVLYDHGDLNEVLRRVDNTMTSVKNIFHEPVNRKAGNLNITTAPGSKALSSAGLNVSQEPVSQMTLLSNSVMDKKALNEDESSSDEEKHIDNNFESKVDYDRFLNLLRQSLNESVIGTSKTEQQVFQDFANIKTPKRENTCNNPKALNGTEVVKRTMSKTAETEHEEPVKEKNTTKKIDKTISNLSTTETNNTVHFNLTANMTYDEMKDAVDNVQKNVKKLEVKSGKSLTNTISSSGNGLTGFTATIIDAVTRLTAIMNEHEEKIAEEKKICAELKTQNEHLKALVNALTVELMSMQTQLQESNLKIEEKQQEYFAKQAEEIGKLKLDFEDLKKHVSSNLNAKQEEMKMSVSQKEIPLVLPTDEEDFEIIDPRKTTTITNKEADDEEEEALKADMILLLNALKNEEHIAAAEPKVESDPVVTKDTIDAAQTMAAVESQLRHLQLQHAEAQNRMQELTQHANDMVHKIEFSQTNSVTHEHELQSENFSTPVDSLQDEPIAKSDHTTFSNEEKLIIEPDSFKFLIPDITDHSDTTISPGSTTYCSRYENIKYDQGDNPMSTLHTFRTTASSNTNITTAISNADLTPRLLQSNITPNDDSDIDANLNTIMEKITAKFKMPRTLSPFKPQTIPVNKQPMNTPNTSPQYEQVISHIAKSQSSLEERISQLNSQHAEAQTRLQKLIKSRSESPSSDQSRHGKQIQVSIPLDDTMNSVNTEQSQGRNAWADILRNQKI